MLRKCILPAVILCLMGCGKESEPLNNLQQIQDLDSRTEAVGRSVSLTKVRVTEVPGDILFWVEDQGVKLPVVLNTELRSPQSEGEFRIRTGQFWNVEGTVRLVSALGADDPVWNLIDADEKARIEEAKIYILSEQLN